MRPAQSIRFGDWKLLEIINVAWKFVLLIYWKHSKQIIYNSKTKFFSECKTLSTATNYGKYFENFK